MRALRRNLIGLKKYTDRILVHPVPLLNRGIGASDTTSSSADRSTNNAHDRIPKFRNLLFVIKETALEKCTLCAKIALLSA